MGVPEEYRLYLSIQPIHIPIPGKGVSTCLPTRKKETLPSPKPDERHDLNDQTEKRVCMARGELIKTISFDMLPPDIHETKKRGQS